MIPVWLSISRCAINPFRRFSMTHAELSTRELVHCCLSKGEQQLWAEFVRRLQPLVAGVVVKTLRRQGVTDLQAVDDLVQDVFLKLCKDDYHVVRVCQIDDEASFFAYIKVVSANVVYDNYKYRSAEKRNYLSEEAFEGDHVADRRQCPGESLVVDVERVLHEENIPARDRSIFWMYFRQGFSAKEIAQSIGNHLSVKGVESCIYRLTSLLRERFAADVAKGDER